MVAFLLCLLAAWTFQVNKIAADSDEHIYGEALPNSCIGKEDGDYWFLLSDKTSPDVQHI